MLWSDKEKPSKLHGLVREVQSALAAELKRDIRLQTDSAESVALVEAATGRSDVLFGVRREREQLGQFDIIEPELLRLSYRLWMLPQQVPVEPELAPEVQVDVDEAQGVVESEADAPSEAAVAAVVAVADEANVDVAAAPAAANSSVTPEPAVTYKQKKPKIKDWRDLRGLTGVIPKGSAVSDEFDRFAKSKLTLTEVDSTLAALQLLDSGEADYAVLEYNNVVLADSQFIAQSPKPLPVGPVIHREGLYLGVSHNSACNSTDLRAALAQKLYDWQQAGTLQGWRKDARALWQMQHGLVEPHQAEPATSMAVDKAKEPVIQPPVSNQDDTPLTPVDGEHIEE
ncbi:substrate-binding periplasmic protein [Atopomonas sediminilitoris]|uniref:substrate-binding periplasmic protein n=1 Tax=Atopomonas sediminilitoris TaxID=2919919 RepID=UPI001F4DEE66|nr:transporter substrate-binding domain-containing protein [Atopomonas sediminilitoris]MCJ8169041.1 transporter substrate-binding domain-containing protein [Atopomonas sediminilitoris]